MALALVRRFSTEVPALCALGVRGLATKKTSDKAVAAAQSAGLTVQQENIPTTIGGGQAFANDLRSVSGLGLGDGLSTHTSKWMQGEHKSPMEYIRESTPIKVQGLVAASYGSEDPSLGAPVQYIDLRGTTPENPAVCKYTGNKYYSDAWKGGGGAH